jgi:hypothetical protein
MAPSHDFVGDLCSIFNNWFLHRARKTVMTKTEPRSRSHGAAVPAQQRGSPNVGTLIFLILGGAFLATGIGLLGWNLRFLANAGKAESEVVRLFEQTSSSSDSTSPTFKPEVRYSVRGGATHTSTATRGTNPPTYKVGEKVLVHYDPTARASMMPDTFVEKWLMPLIFIALGTIFAIMGIA